MMDDGSHASASSAGLSSTARRRKSSFGAGSVDSIGSAESPSSLSSRTQRRNSWGAAAPSSPGSEAAAPAQTVLQKQYGLGDRDRGWPDWDPSPARLEGSVGEYCKRIRSICASPSDARRTSECVETLNALTMMLESDPIVRTQALDAGLADLVLHTVPQKSARAPNAVDAYRACARATRCLARSAQQADSLARAGAARALLQLARAHPDYLGLHEHVCAAMSNIAQHRSGRVYRQQVQEGGAVGLRDFLANAMAANAVPWALEAMEKFAQHEPLQRHALSLLRSLAASEPPNAPPAAVGSRSIPPPASYDAVMLSAGSVAPVLQALQTHMNSPALTTAGLGVLGNLSMEYTTNNLERVKVIAEARRDAEQRGQDVQAAAKRAAATFDAKHPATANRGSAWPGARVAVAPASTPLHPAADGAASSLSGCGDLSSPPVSRGAELVPWPGSAQPDLEEPPNFSCEDVSETTMPVSVDDDAAGSVASSHVSSHHEPRAPLHVFDRSDAHSHATV